MNLLPSEARQIGSYVSFLKYMERHSHLTMSISPCEVKDTNNYFCSDKVSMFYSFNYRMTQESGDHRWLCTLADNKWKRV